MAILAPVARTALAATTLPVAHIVGCCCAQEGYHYMKVKDAFYKVGWLKCKEVGKNTEWHGYAQHNVQFCQMCGTRLSEAPLRLYNRNSPIIDDILRLL